MLSNFIRRIFRRTKLPSDIIVESGVRFVKRYDVAGGNLFIGKNVIIGANSVIYPVNIHSGAIILGGSVVMNDVPKDAIVGGNPAKVINYR